MGTKVLGIGGALILVATAALHLSGYGALAGQLNATSLPDFWSAAMKATWVSFGVQLVLIAAVVSAQFAQRSTATANRAVLVICLAFLIANVVVLAVWLGVFVGTVAIAVATLSIGTATAMLARGA